MSAHNPNTSGYGKIRRDYRKAIIAWFKECIRKFLVNMKRNPQFIPLAMGLIAFIFYSFNLTAVSNATAKIQGAGMGLSQFCIMLFSLLSLVCMLNAFPRRQKPNVPMVVLMYAMFGVIAFCDFHYCNMIMNALNRPVSPIVLNESTRYIADAYNMLNTHMILVGVTAVLVALLPVYSKLIRKIKTSITVEDNGSMAAIEINE